MTATEPASSERLHHHQDDDAHHQRCRHLVGEAIEPLITGVAVWLLEIGYPFLIWHRRLRRPWLIAILLMHAGVGIAMGMYLFASVMIVLNLAAFGPGILWPQLQTADDASSLPDSLAPSPNN